MNKKDEIKLYNMIMPIWLLLLMPYMWWVSIAGNLIIDLLVVSVSLRVLRVANIKEKLKKSLLKTYIIGFLSDFIGCVPLLVVMFGLSDKSRLVNELQQSLMKNPFSSLMSFAIVTFCVILTSLLIYILNMKLAFNKLELDLSQKKKLAISVAIFTAPYLFYLPAMYY